MAGCSDQVLRTTFFPECNVSFNAREEAAREGSVGHEASLYIGGEWTAPGTDAAIEVISPHSGEAIGGLAVARRVRTGTFGVNQPYTMDPAAPFGGVKASGFGRELGPEGLDEFLDTKAISVAEGRA
jgi:acyl-CoA reductase-like NAD-dependent aldehyde dehydrogenase